MLYWSNMYNENRIRRCSCADKSRFIYRRCRGPRVDSRNHYSLCYSFQSEKECGKQDWECRSKSKRNHWRCCKDCRDDEEGISFGSKGRVHQDKEWTWERDERKKSGVTALWEACTREGRIGRQTVRCTGTSWEQTDSEGRTSSPAWSQSRRT